MNQFASNLFVFGFAKRHGFGDVEGVFDLRWDGFPSGGEQLYCDWFLELAEALKSLQCGGRASVFQHSPQHWNILLHCGYREVAIQDIITIFSSYSQVMSIVWYTSMALLFDVNVSGSTWNRHNVFISMAKEMGKN